MKKKTACTVLLIIVISVLTTVPNEEQKKDLPSKTETITVQETVNRDEPPKVVTHVFTEQEKRLTEMKSKIVELNEISDSEQWFIGYKEILSEYSDVWDSPKTIYDEYTPEELTRLFRVVQAEVGDEYGFKQKCDVASVIFNRVKDGRFGDTLTQVLNPDQFSCIKDGRYKEVEISDETILACEYAYMIEDTTNGCLFFDRYNKLKYKLVFNDGAHYFYKTGE